MKIPQEKIQKLAEYTYFMHRKANDSTPYADLSKADKQSYLNEAKEQIEYINDNLEIIGASPEEVDKLVHSLASTMEHSVMLMRENASLKQTIALREASIHDMKDKMQKMQEKLDTLDEVYSPSHYMDDDMLKACDVAPIDPTPATDSIDRAHILAVMSRYGFEKAKVAISKELGESKPVQMKASKANWIARYEQKYGFDVLLKASEVCDGAA